MDEYIKVGIIGAGNMGSSHLAAIAEGKIRGMRASAVCDIDEERLARVGAKYPDVALFESCESFFESSDTDAVIIAVPHPMHAEIAETAFACGKHVLVEKPVDISVRRARELAKAAKESGRAFGIMLNQRMNPLFREARRIVSSGELGEIKRSSWIITNWYRTQSYYDSGDWRATWRGEGGGVLLNQAVHNLDIWQWICGMPVSVTAFCPVGKYHNIEVEDEATVFVQYKNGASGVLIASTGELPGTNRLEIAGERGKIVIENGKMKHLKLAESEREICFNSRESFVAPEAEIVEITPEGDTAHAGILQNFANHILFGEELTAPGEDGINELEISNAAYLSEWLGNKKIDLPIDAALFDKMLEEKRRASSLKVSADTPSEDENHTARWQVNW